MEGVAARAGVSKALGYRYFTNRDDLLLALFDREMAILDQRISDAVATAQDFESGLRGIVLAWVDLIVDRGRLLGSLQQSKLIEGPVEQRRSGRQDRLDSFFARLITDSYDVDPEDALLVAATLVSGSEGAMRVWISRVRRKLGSEPGDMGRIKTFQGIGYLLDVEPPTEPLELDEATVEAAKAAGRDDVTEA